jgi:hypothetical protein
LSVLQRVVEGKWVLKMNNREKLNKCLEDLRKESKEAWVSTTSIKLAKAYILTATEYFNLDKEDRSKAFENLNKAIEVLESLE